ncbi:histidine kinase N-terminal 7TM domain-containing protein [Anoxynatronum buryatiense]|uniref:N-terminal 7TM region of histidine kinase n=1 Tax=Anoxynatronum buryatiense TaxID=489973 RepID=A0AA45WY64_9CLOT|nr:histidine kinase N-terminal 7TM domain-containing protein [Anoxynatronum buryatiense]SMP65638.1 N-terminal 7TM region of histidine kinase [Anoxynatronum buryatiense]
MTRKGKWTYIAVVGILVFMLLAINVITRGSPDLSVQFRNDIPHYDALLPITDEPLHIAYELQAQALLEAGVAKEYRRDFISTIIIAVDRDLVSDQISGWRCLEKGDYAVYFPYRFQLSHVVFGSSLQAMSIGLDGNNGENTNSLRLLRLLHNEGRLVSGEPEVAPVAILFDHQAAQLIKEGKRLEIIVPEEGTLSLPVGIMSTQSTQLPLVSPGDLMGAGFRLPNGDCDLGIYPDEGAYAVASIADHRPGETLKTVFYIADFRRKVLRERLLTPSNGLENTLSYLGFMMVIVVWSGFLLMRISEKASQQKLFAISGLLLFWMLVRTIKIMTQSSPFDRALWYLFYIPLTFLPVLLLWVGQILINTDSSPMGRRLRNASMLVSCLLSLLVLTNDVHQRVFYFYRGTSGNMYDLYYSYGWVYYFIFFWSFFLIFVFVFLAMKEKTESKWKRAVPLLLLLTASTVYFGGYSLGISLMRQSEFSIAYGIFALAFLEICFRNRLIPNNTQLGKLLHKAPVNLHILSDTMQVEYETECARQLPETLAEHLKQQMAKENLSMSFRLPGCENYLYDVNRIQGGYAVVTQSLDTVIQMRKTLEQQNRTIEGQNQVLTRTLNIEGELVRLRTQQQLYDQIETVVKDKVKTINSHVNQWFKKEGAERNTDVMQRRLAHIKVIVNYCKRRIQLALLEAGGEDCSGAEIALWLRESLWEAENMGIMGMVTETDNITLSSKSASILYDDFQELLESPLLTTPAVILLHLSVEEGDLVVRIALETKGAWKVAGLKEVPAFRRISSVTGVTLTFAHNEDELIIDLKLPGGGQAND